MTPLESLYNKIAIHRQEIKQMKYFQIENMTQGRCDVFLSAFYRGGVEVVQIDLDPSPPMKNDAFAAHLIRLYMMSDVLFAYKVGKIIKIEPFILQATVFGPRIIWNFLIR